MTIEYLLLLFIFVFVLMGTLVNGPRDSFLESGPRLGARIEMQIATGEGFKPKTTGGSNQWIVPPK